MDYIGRNFIYGEDKQWSIENEMNTGVPFSTRLNGNRENRELSRDKKFVGKKIMI